MEIHKVAQATTASPAIVSDEYLPLTFFDAIWVRFPPTQRVFFYQINDLSVSVFFNDILPKLKHALSLTLQYYPPLAGKLIWHPVTGKPVIHLAPDDCISLAVAESGADFDSLSTYEIKEAKNLYPLLSDLDVSENQTKVLALQVTVFPGYGFAIGYTAHHAALDGKSAAMFFKSWAKICQVGFLTPELTPVWERSLINDPLDLCLKFSERWKRMPPEGTFRPMEMKPAAGLFRGTFRLTRQQISYIKGKIDSPVSSFTAACSYIWNCLVKAEGDIKNENVLLGINMECRARLKPPIPANYVGNCVVFRMARSKVVSLEGEEGLAIAAEAIKEAVGSLPEGAVKGAEKWFSDESFKDFVGQKVYTIGGSQLFEFYGADFGWGRPTKVEMVSIDKSGAFSLCDARDGNGGMEIGIVLNKSKIQAFSYIFNQGLENIFNK